MGDLRPMIRDYIACVVIDELKCYELKYNTLNIDRRVVHKMTKLSKSQLYITSIGTLPESRNHLQSSHKVFLIFQ